jgi:3-carboxy-cis,cis-muconate cycloisomerase
MFSPLDSLLTAPLLATPAMRGVFSDGARVGAMLRVEAALAAAEARVGLAPAGLAGAIRAIAPEDLDLVAIGEATALSGVPTIPFVKAVQRLLPAALERAFHKGATTQDILDTALVLQCREALALLRRDLVAIMAGLAVLAERYRAAPCAGRTYGQHAAPVTFGFKVAVWLAGIADVAARLPAVREGLLVASLGGPVGTLAALRGQGPAVLEGFAAELGLGVPVVTWHTTRARVAEAGAWLATLIGALAKMAVDVAHLASTEVSEVAEPYVPGRGGSSAMPHKRNPVSCTVILAAHAAAPGLAATLLGAMAAAHERPAGLWHGEWHALPQLFGLASGALHEARALAEGLEVDAARMRRNLDCTRGLLFADAAAGVLTARLGREGAHHAVEVAAGEVRASGEALAGVLARLYPEVDTSGAFDLTPAIAAASPWVDRALAHAAEVQTLLQD